jgi:NADH-quinone oxidoreductase subunit M
MGFALLGMAALNKFGMNAAQLQNFNHGIISGSLFLLVGVIYDRAHTREVNAFGGLLPQMRIYGILFIIASMANLGLPGLAGFWGEFWSLLGAIQNKEFLTRDGLIFFRALAPVAVLGIIITAAYMLIMVKKVFMGDLDERWKWLPDLDARELVSIIPLIILIILIGIYPNPLIALFDGAMNDLVESIRFAAAVPPAGF